MPKTEYAQVILLLADGFEEAATVILLTTLRQVGLAVSLVSLRSKRVNGAHGLTVIPNASLDQLLATPPPLLALILPGGTAHLARLQLDPRVNSLLQHSLREEAMLVGLDPQATKLITDLTQLYHPPGPTIEPEAGMPLEHFASVLAQQLIGMMER